MEIGVSPVFEANYYYYQANQEHLNKYKHLPKDEIPKSPYRIIINRGGTRSGKSYSLMQVLIKIALETNYKIEVAAKEKASHDGKCLSDFKEIMTDWNAWRAIERKNETKLLYEFNSGASIRFIGLDSALKKRGQGRQILFMNECNAFSLEDWKQLAFRTGVQIFMDYNPSEYFWLDEDVLERRKDYKMIHSTYKDNYDFLPIEQIREIEDLIDSGDQYYIDVYVKGIMGTFKGKIYSGYNTIHIDDYKNLPICETWYAIDWGYEHNMVLKEFKYYKENIYERELFSKSHHKVDEDLIPFMNSINISRSADIYCDHAYPTEISRLQEAGFNARKAVKDVKPGIRFMQQMCNKWYISSDSASTLKYITKYKWKQDKNGKIYEGEPVKVDDDEMDTSRYGIYTHLRKRINAVGISW